MAKAWSDFFPLVQPYVPGCPETVLESHLQEAAADFCERSEVWTFDIEFGITVEGVSDYYVDVPLNAAIENIHGLFLEGALLPRITEAYDPQDAEATQGRPHSYTIHHDEQIRFFPTPDKRYEYTGTGVLKPTLSATGVEDFIYATHGRAIAHGALSLLAAIPNKEWTDQDLASYYGAKFAKACDDAKGRDIRRTVTRVQSVKFA